MDMNLLYAAAVAIVATLFLFWWSVKRRTRPGSQAAEGDRLDTLIGWPPEATRVLRNAERLAFSTLKLALPGYMILSQVPIARFINVPKRNSYAEWMRRLGSQCVDFVICDVTSQVVAVVDVRPPDAQLSDRVRRRLERVARTLKSVDIPLHVWNEESLPSIETARSSIVPKVPAVPMAVVPRKPVAETATSAAGVAAMAKDGRNPFEDTDRDSTQDEVIEVVELSGGRSSTWFDELDSVSSTLLPPSQRKSG